MSILSSTLPDSRGNGFPSSFDRTDRPSPSNTRSSTFGEDDDALINHRRPPYHPPPNIVYPQPGIPNPYYGYEGIQPTFAPLSPGSLSRPAILPIDTDERLDKASIWVTIDADGKPAYMLPPTCAGCRRSKVAQLCDRAWPTCGRCKVRKEECIPGTEWACMRPRTHRRNLKAEQKQEQARKKYKSIEAGAGAVNSSGNHPPSTLRAPSSGSAPVDAGLMSHSGSDNDGERSERRYSSDEKGKGKAVVETAPLPVLHSVAGGLPDSTQTLDDDNIQNGMSVIGEGGHEGGRGKRVKKKRRLSASGEIDPNTVRANGKSIKKPRQSTPTNDGWSLSSGAVVHLPLLPETAKDKAYNARVKANSLKTPFTGSMRRIPLWADNRRALQVCAEYLNRPSKTLGASVESGAGGLARGVILEGEAPGLGNWWSLEEKPEIIMIHIGKARRRWYKPDRSAPGATIGEQETIPQSDYDTIPRPITPPFNLTRSVMLVDSSDPTWTAILPSCDEPSIGPTIQFDMPPPPPEEPEIDALLMAQRARTPVALAVSEDYSLIPFAPFKPLFVLGWFWVVDAWLEPVLPEDAALNAKGTTALEDFISSIDTVRWKFKFEWCKGAQGAPWWTSTAPSKSLLDMPIPPSPMDESWQVAGPGSRGSTTVRRLRPMSEISFGVCSECRRISEVVYEWNRLCLDESCPRFFTKLSMNGERLRDDVPLNTWLGPISIEPSISRPAERIEPEALGLKLLPAEVVGQTSEMTGALAGRDYWRGWVCTQCLKAHERRYWHGWECDECGLSYSPERRIYSADFLRSPTRPVCTGPRQDDGFPNWPFPVTQSWALFNDDIKVVKHGLEAAFGDGAEVHHALHCEGKNAHPIVKDILRNFQSQGDRELPFRRYIMNDRISNKVDKFLSPFYTLLYGPDSVSPLEALPTGIPTPWQKSPSVCLDFMDVINERCGRMFEGQPEFNSLLIAACPPNLATSAYPKIEVPPNSFLALAFLGSDGSVKFRKNSSTSTIRVRQGELIVQNGDVIGIKTGPEAMDVLPKLDRFGFISIARQLYQQVIIPSEGLDTSMYNQPTPTYSKKKHQIQTDSNLPPPIPTKLPTVPLTGWYIGYRALIDTESKQQVITENGKDTTPKYGKIATKPLEQTPIIEPPVEFSRKNRNRALMPVPNAQNPKIGTLPKKSRKSFGGPSEIGDNVSETISINGNGGTDGTTALKKKRGRKSAVEKLDIDSVVGDEVVSEVGTIGGSASGGGSVRGKGSNGRGKSSSRGGRASLK